jgi:hypothetical protein
MTKISLIVEVVKVKKCSSERTKASVTFREQMVVVVLCFHHQNIRQSLNIEVSCDGDCLCPNLPMLLTSWHWRHS